MERTNVSVKNARVITDDLHITLAEAGTGHHHILMDVALDEDEGEHKESRLHVRIIGEIPELFAIKEWVRGGMAVTLYGRLIGDRSHHMSCWARNVRKANHENRPVSE